MLKPVRTATVLTAIAAAFTIAAIAPAPAYVGVSFLQIPGLPGTWKGEPYKSWTKVDGNYWKGAGPIGLGSAGLGRNPASFSGPGGPAKGEGALVVAVDKDNPALPQLMERCASKAALGEVTYAESADRARSPQQIGPRPAEVPAYFEYKLKDAAIVDCPVVADAPQQAFVVGFKDIERLNYHSDVKFVPVTLVPSPLKPLPPSPKVRSFVLTWFAVANDVSDDQCPVMNAKPTEDDYYALMTKEDANKERAALGDKGVNYQNGQMGVRGPHKLDVCQMPGIVRDPGNAEPVTKLAFGLNLDGNDGTGAAPAGTCKHPNYSTPDGRVGIDNQLFRAEGCISSFQGHKGFIMQFANNQMHDGQMSLLVQISGIDNETNDDSVDVTLFYSLDPMAKNASGSLIAPDYTFRVSDNPEYAHYFARLHGRITNGIITTEPVKTLTMNLGQYGTPNELVVHDARLRLEMSPEGTLKGVLGGYMDWRMIISRYISSTVEVYHGFQVPGLYNALKHNADGMKDPATGQCNGISSAYAIEGIRAFIAPAAPTVANKDRKQVADAQPQR